MSLQLDILTRLTDVHWPTGKNVLEFTAMYWPGPKTTGITVRITMEGAGAVTFPPMIAESSDVTVGVVQPKTWKDLSVWNYPTIDQPLEYYNDGTLFIKQFTTNTWIVNLNKILVDIKKANPDAKLPDKITFRVDVEGNLGRTDTNSSGSYGFGGWLMPGPYGYPTDLVLFTGSSLADVGAAITASYPGDYPYGSATSILESSPPWPTIISIRVRWGPNGESSSPEALGIGGSWNYSPPEDFVRYDDFNFRFVAKSYKTIKTVDVEKSVYDPTTDYDLGSHYEAKPLVGPDNVHAPETQRSDFQHNFAYGGYDAETEGTNFSHTFRFVLDTKELSIEDA